MKERWKEELYEIADLERARLLLYPADWKRGADERVAAALAAARRESIEQAKDDIAQLKGDIEEWRGKLAEQCGKTLGAAEEMRERAAQAAEGGDEHAVVTRRTISAAIRALPLTPEEPT